MQIKHKILIAATAIIALTLSHLYTYYLASEKEEFKSFLNDISYSSILLGALEDNKTVVVKSLLSDNIDRVFLETENREINLFLPLCKYTNKKNTWMIKEHNKFVSLSSKDIEKRINNGKEKIEQLCKIQ